MGEAGTADKAAASSNGSGPMPPPHQPAAAGWGRRLLFDLVVLGMLVLLCRRVDSEVFWALVGFEVLPKVKSWFSEFKQLIKSATAVPSQPPQRRGQRADASGYATEPTTDEQAY